MGMLNSLPWTLNFGVVTLDHALGRDTAQVLVSHAYFRNDGAIKPSSFALPLSYPGLSTLVMLPWTILPVETPLRHASALTTLFE
eukprot:6198526-Pleurochrysis_carterae.AAC.1